MQGRDCARSTLRLLLSLRSTLGQSGSPNSHRSIKSVVGQREAGSVWSPCCGLNSAAEGGPVCCAVRAAPGSCEESAGELGPCDMVSAGLLSQTGRRGSYGGSFPLQSSARCRPPAVAAAALHLRPSAASAQSTGRRRGGPPFVP